MSTEQIEAMVAALKKAREALESCNEDQQEFRDEGIEYVKTYDEQLVAEAKELIRHALGEDR